MHEELKDCYVRCRLWTNSLAIYTFNKIKYFLFRVKQGQRQGQTIFSLLTFPLAEINVQN